MKRVACILLVLSLGACSSDNKSNEQALLDSLNAVETTPELEISDEVLGDIIQQIPSPLEISVMLKESGRDYSKSILNSTDNTDKYNTNYSRALNLGIYGTDLGYTNIYQKNQDGLFYLNSIKQLADELNIGQFFDFSTISRLASHSDNLDSLLLITTRNFNNINAHLQEQKRSNLSILLLTGGWLEALHITCSVYNANPSQPQLREKIGEQKIILENIVLLLSFYTKTNPQMAGLHEDMVKLKNEFDKVEINYTYEESTFKEVDGVLMIVDNSTSTIIITDEDVASITKITSEIREKIIN